MLEKKIMRLPQLHLKLSLTATLFLLITSPLFGGIWQDNGIELRGTGESNPEGKVLNARMIKTNSHIWILWLDTRNSEDDYHGGLVLQKMSNDGNILLEDDGILLEDHGICPDQQAFGLVNDGQGGVYVCSSDQTRDGLPKVVQRYDTSGVAVWEEPVIIPGLFSTQYLAHLNNGSLLLFSGAGNPSLALVNITENGDTTSTEVFSESNYRSAMPIGLERWRSGWLATAQVVRSANTSVLRRLRIRENGTPYDNADGEDFYMGRVITNGFFGLEENQSLLMYTSYESSLVGALFSSNGLLSWSNWGGVELHDGPVGSYAACGAGHDMWLQVRDFSGDMPAEILYRVSNYANQETDELVLTEQPALSNVITPVPDGEDGAFVFFTDELEGFSRVIQVDSGGEIRPGYTDPVPMDQTGLESTVCAAMHGWHDLLVTFTQDRDENGRTGLYIQRMVNDVVSGIEEEPRVTILPSNIELLSVWPEPFNSTTNLRVKADHPGEAQIRVYNLLGQMVLERSYAFQRAGVATLPLVFDNQPAGTYYVAATKEGITRLKRVTLVK